MGILRRLREWREDKDGTLIGPDIEADSVDAGSVNTDEARIGAEGDYDPIHSIRVSSSNVSSDTYTQALSRENQPIIDYTNALNTSQYDTLAVSFGVDVHAPDSPSASIRLSKTDRFGDVDTPITDSEITDSFDNVSIPRSQITDVSSFSRLTIEGKTSDGNTLFIRGATIYIWGRVL